MRLLLNIGLHVNATQTVAAHVAFEILKANGFLITRHRTVQSDTEPTLVADVLFAGMMADLSSMLHQTSVDLQQDCIAAYNVAKNRGVLVGPRAAEWGPFNPEFFFLLDGTRLQAPVAKAA